MSNTPEDTRRNYQGKQIEKEDNQSVTRVSFRIPVDSILFYRRMAPHMFEAGVIKEPRLSLLAKAMLTEAEAHASRPVIERVPNETGTALTGILP
jgi:hypothetical protein